MIQETTQVAQEEASTGVPWSQTLTSGFVGALFVFLFGAIGRGVERRRERIALMKVVHMEITHNELAVQRLSEEKNPFETGYVETGYVETGYVETGYVSSLHNEAWTENRARLARLEDERAVEYLGMYYTSVGTVLTTDRLYKETDNELLLIALCSDTDPGSPLLSRTWRLRYQVASVESF